MRIVVGSALRNMSGRVNGWFRQIHDLKQHAGEAHELRVIAVHGDSMDETERELHQFGELWEMPLEIVEHSHGHQVFASTEEPLRMEALSGVLRAGMGAVKKDDDVLVWIESDLLWEPHDIGSVIDIVDRGDDDFDVVAPLVFAGDLFYDVWGFRGMDGERFSPWAPYHSSMQPHGLTEVKSVGSCLVMKGDVAMSVKTPQNKQALVGWCAAARKKKYKIGVAADFRVRHPA